jgi:AcrR family transcriptional regulator
MKQIILLEAVNIARSIGFQAITRKLVAIASCCSVGTVNYHFETMDALRDAVIGYAIEHETLEILAQARAMRHPLLRGKLSPALKERVVAYITRR